MNRILRLILALMILTFFVTGALAQSVTTGSISGIVTDQSGAAVPDITVTATSPNLIQPQSATTAPDGLYTIAPSATRSGLRDASGRDRDPSIAGSSGPENNYILDGVSTGDPAFGGGGANLPFEFVQEVEIKTGAYGAEYGKSTGGIFNVITKSGSNRISGD